MIYINNSTEYIEIPRFSAKLGDRLVLINQITKVELSVTFEDDGLGSSYRIPVGDIIERFETGQYDYYLYGGDFDLGKGILQFDDFSKKVVEYNDDIEVIQYTPDMEYTPVPDRVIKIENNGVYDVKSYDKADVDVLPQPAILPNNTTFQVSNQTECPSFDYRNLTTANKLFYDNNDLVKIGEMLNTGNITNMSSMFNWCNSLIYAPNMDTSKVTNMSYMFSVCESLKTIPLYDISNVTTMESMLFRCDDLEYVPKFDTSNVINMRKFWGSIAPYNKCTEFPQLDTSNVKDMEEMIGCRKNLNVPLLNCPKVSNIKNIIYRGYNYTLGGFRNLGKGFTNSQVLDCSYSENAIIGDSLQNIIDTVYDMNQNTKGGRATLKLHQTVINSMSDAQKSQLAAKGWTLTN